MRVSIRKTVVAAVAALGMATAVVTISTPAEAQWHGGGGGFHGGGFHGGGFGGGGFRGGGWGGGGWHGGGWRGGGWGRPGWGGGGWGWRRAGWGGGWNGGWGGGCWNCGWGWGGGWGWDPGWAIAAATVPIGVAIASQPAYGGGPGLLGQAACLDGERPLYGPAACQRLRLTVRAPCRSMTMV